MRVEEGGKTCVVALIFHSSSSILWPLPPPHDSKPKVVWATWEQLVMSGDTFQLSQLEVAVGAIGIQ